MISIDKDKKARWPGGAGIARISGTWNNEVVEWRYSATETPNEPEDTDFQLMGPLATITWQTTEDKRSFNFFLPDGVWVQPYVKSGPGTDLTFFIDQILTKVEGQSTGQLFPYSTRYNVEMIYGKTNVAKWADVDNQEDPIFINQRIEWAIGLADTEINSKLAESSYQIPFSMPIDPLVVDLSARYAGVLLYDSRLITDNPSKTDQVSIHRKMFFKTIAQLQAGQRRLSFADRKWTSYPKNIIDSKYIDEANATLNKTTYLNS